MEDFLEDIKKIALAAGEIIKADYNKNVKIDYKGRANLVTETDIKVERAIVNEIKNRYPGHKIVAEEGTSKTSGDSRYVWYIDPLDGTTNFAHAFPMFCTSIALADEGEMIAGVVYNPVYNELYYAAKGKGAYLNGEKISVSGVTDIKDAMLVTGFAYNFRDVPENNFADFYKFSCASQAVRRTGSAAIDMCFLAAGRSDGYWELNLNPWDVAAGYLIISEAGGKVTGYSGEKFDIFGKKVVASNGLLHDEMIRILNER